MKIIQYKDRKNLVDKQIQYNKYGGIIKFQNGGNSGEIKSDDRSWLRRQWDNLATAYNTSKFAKSAPALVLANGTPFGVLHYGLSGSLADAALSAIPLGRNIKGGISKALQFANGKLTSVINGAKKGVNSIHGNYDNLATNIGGASKYLKNNESSMENNSSSLTNSPNKLSEVSTNKNLEKTSGKITDVITGGNKLYQEYNNPSSTVFNWKPNNK